MQIERQKFKYWFKSSACLGLSILFVFVGLGCAITHKTTQTETVVTKSNNVGADETGQNTVTTVSTSGDQQNKEVVEKTQTTTTTSEKSGGHPGILSSTVHAIGWVIALPFRLVGGLIGWIF
jgi:hypothetical protein